MTTIRKQMLALAVAALATLSTGQAQAITYNFDGTIEQGALTGQAFGGQFSFDDSTLDANTDWLPLSSLEFVFDGQGYNLAGAAAGSTSVSFSGGEILGIDAVYGDDTQGFVLTNGFGSPYLAYTAGNFGSYTVSVAAAVPEPASWALGLSGLAAVGAIVRRRRPQPASA